MFAAKTKEVININKIGTKVVRIRKIDFSSRWLNLNLKFFLRINFKSIKKGIGDVNIDVTFMNVTFKPGDYIYADLDGIIISKKELNIM